MRLQNRMRLITTLGGVVPPGRYGTLYETPNGWFVLYDRPHISLARNLPESLISSIPANKRAGSNRLEYVVSGTPSRHPYFETHFREIPMLDVSQLV